MTINQIIRNVRERFNKAIKEKDAKTIRTLLAPTYHIVTGRSDQFHGQDEEAKRWASVLHTCWKISESLRCVLRQMATKTKWRLGLASGSVHNHRVR